MIIASMIYGFVGSMLATLSNATFGWPQEVSHQAVPLLVGICIGLSIFVIGVFTVDKNQ